MIIVTKAVEPTGIEIFFVTDLIQEMEFGQIAIAVLQNTITRDILSQCELHHEHVRTIAHTIIMMLTLTV